MSRWTWLFLVAVACSPTVELDATSAGGARSSASALSTAVAPMNNIRASHGLVGLPDGRVLAFGGEQQNFTYPNATEIYDSSTGVWSPSGSMNQGRSQFPWVVLPGGDVLVLGGRAGSSTYLTTVERYSVASGAWTVVGNLGTPRMSHTATLLADGRVLVTGGVYATQSPVDSNTAELFNPVTGTSTPAALMSTRRSNHTATLLADGRVLVAGGYDGNGVVSTAQLFDPATETFGPALPMTYPRTHHNAVRLSSGKVLLAGGGGGAGLGYAVPCELFDPATATFAVTGSLSYGRTSFPLLPIPDGALAFGGYPGVLASVERYSATSGTWTVVGALVDARYAHAAAPLNGKYLVTGGLSAAYQYFASAELYDDNTVCVPESCSHAGANCGTMSDGCGGTLECGSCPVGETCTNNVCTPPCTPTTCAAQSATCGSIPDGCGGTLECGSCPVGETCTNNVCTPSCTPTTCAAQGATCGSIPDGCGGTLVCGTCATGQTCSNNVCVAAACSHSECVTGTSLIASCSSCATTVCASDLYCCNVSWDSVCVNEAKSMCGSTCTPPPDACAHSECVTGSALISGCSACVSTVCARDSYCCSTAWDSICVNEAKSWCGLACQ